MGKKLAMAPKVFIIALVLTVVSGETQVVSGLRNQTAKQLLCVENEEYAYNGYCCKNCEAGTYVKEKCTANQEKGTCELCKMGTFAEHPTGMDQCLQCMQCNADQIMTERCTRTRDTQCKCKEGFFCLPDEPCEVCKKCARCKSGEIEVHACTSTSNTKCKKQSVPPGDPTEAPKTTSDPVNTGAIVAVVLLFVFLLVVGAIFFIWFKKKHQCGRQARHAAQPDEVKIPIEGVSVPTSEERQNSRNVELEEAEEPREPLLQETQCKSVPVEDEDRGLGDSLPNTTSSSQTSLSAPPVTPPLCNPSHGEKDVESWAKDDGTPRHLVPLLGEELSLSKSFDLFDVLDIRVHNKFFRSIGLNDNAIKLAESHHAADKVYELLRTWMQREGLRANINHLLQALLELDQRYSAEQIASRAVERGYYRYE